MSLYGSSTIKRNNERRIIDEIGGRWEKPREDSKQPVNPKAVDTSTDNFDDCTAKKLSVTSST
jgi:hypothetical protein